MIKTIGLMAALTCASVTFSATAQTPPPPPPPEAKMRAEPYVMAAGASDLYEINSSQIAVAKSSDPAVRRFAAMMIKHHQQTTAATVAAARKAGLTPMPASLDAGATASINELQTAAPADFDRLYLGQQVPAHQAALDLNKSYAMDGDKPALRASAKKAVPIVQQHLTAAERMMTKSKGAPHAM
jgi:putative membrane protein